MANTIHVDVVSAEEQIFSGEAEFVVLPGDRGRARHLPAPHAAASRRSSRARCASSRRQAQEELVFVAGRLPRSAAARVTVLADTAIRAQGPRRGQGAGSQARRRGSDAEQASPEEIAKAAGRAREAARPARGDPQAQHRAVVRPGQLRGADARAGMFVLPQTPRVRRSMSQCGTWRRLAPLSGRGLDQSCAAVGRARSRRPSGTGGTLAAHRQRRRERWRRKASHRARRRPSAAEAWRQFA